MAESSRGGPRSSFLRIFKRNRSEKQAQRSSQKEDAPPPYVKTSPVLPNPQREEPSHHGQAPEPALSPTSLATTPSTQLMPPSTDKVRPRSRSRDRRLEPQGLNVVYEPQQQRIADIIFVHGLGGSSISTWSKDQDGELFWPEKFLAKESGLSNTRILTFGYTAFYWDINASGSLSITDFARSLLAGLKNEPELAFGQVPIIFVAHSLGGLVVKKAYTLGLFNDTFKDIVSSILAMVFIGTPHHGSNLAKSLNRLLAASIVGPSPKQYVADLDENSTAIEDLNEQFRNIPSELQIASFYETRLTLFGIKKLMVVDKKSSVIGCRGEIPQPLDADHHNLCKFDSPDDANYIRVRNVMQSIVRPLVDSTLPNATNAPKALEKLSMLLHVSKAPEDDQNFYFDRWMPETCAWILSKDSPFTKWTVSTQDSQILWINGPLGTGKSVLASYLINHFRALGVAYAFYFFRSGDHVLRSVCSFIRSIAFQIAQQYPRYRQQLEEIYDAGDSLQKSDAKLLWQKLIHSTLCQLETGFSIYVIVDGLDESDSPQKMLSLISSTPSLPMRLVLLSRPSHAIVTSLGKLPNSFAVTRMSIDSTNEDIAVFVENELESMHASDALKQNVVHEITQRASGNFLWVHLAVKEVLNCHTQDEVNQALQGIPTDMHPLYKRIEDGMTESLKLSDQRLAKALLMWVSCSRRILSLEELSEALEPEFGNILDLSRTINQTCGNLLTVDRKSRITFVHQTAREYLTKFSTGQFAIARAEANEELFLRCMRCLGDIRLRSLIKQLTPPALLSYATTSWHTHLRASFAGSSPVFTALSAFLEDTAVLTWIQVAATENRLATLVHSSQSLATFVERRRVYDASIAPNLRPLEALEVMDLWTTDLIKIVGKFGRNLIDMPEAIHKFIPQFCPRNSAIHRQLGRKGAFSVHIPGDSHASWDDSLARIFVGAEPEALSIACFGQHFAIHTSKNSIIIWNAETCQEVRRLSHQDRIMTFCASQDGRMIASYGSRMTKVWEIATGREILSIPSASESRILEMVFIQQSSTLLVSTVDKIIWRLEMNETEPSWQSTDLQFLQDQMVPSRNASSSPYTTAFSPHGSQIAMGFRGAPLSVWTLDNPQLVARCRREKSDQFSFDGQPWSPVDKIIWHPRAAEIIGIYMGGAIFKWDPLEDSSQEVDAAASTVTCNIDGDLIASSDANGTVKIWKSNDFTLIYQLRYEYPVAALAFGPDSRRFYDLRGSFCNVWEPNVLVRLSDFEKFGSEASSDRASVAVSTTMSEAEIDIKEPVTALAPRPSGNDYVAGNSEGVVTLLQRFGESGAEIWTSASFMPIEHLSWDAHGNHIAIRELSGRVIVKALDSLKPSQQSGKPLFDKTINLPGEVIQQILLSPKAESVLVAARASVQLYSINQGALEKEWRSEDPEAAFRWLNHPSHADQILAVGADCVITFTWSNLENIASIKLDLQRPHSSSKSEGRAIQIRRPSDPSLILNKVGTMVEQVILTQDKRHVILESIRFSSTSTGERQLDIIPLASLLNTSAPIKPLYLPNRLLEQVQLPLGVLAGDKFVFLDNQSWICSWHLSARDEARALKRYFFLPRDWLNAECLELCRLLANGVLLIPRQGEVAAIKSDLSLQW